jgi:hypothetical protein
LIRSTRNRRTGSGCRYRITAEEGTRNRDTPSSDSTSRVMTTVGSPSSSTITLMRAATGNIDSLVISSFGNPNMGHLSTNFHARPSASVSTTSIQPGNESASSHFTASHWTSAYSFTLHMMPDCRVTHLSDQRCPNSAELPLTSPALYR